MASSTCSENKEKGVVTCLDKEGGRPRYYYRENNEIQIGEKKEISNSSNPKDKVILNFRSDTKFSGTKYN